MKVAIAPVPLLAAFAVVLAAVAAVSFTLMSRPDDADVRIAKVRGTMAQVARLDKQPGAPGVLPLGAVCSGSAATAAANWKSQATKAAARRGVPSDGLRMEAGSNPQRERLSPLQLQWKGSTDYVAFVGLLSDLEALKPILFVDALDIKPRGARAEFELKGRVWCWTPVDSRS